MLRCTPSADSCPARSRAVHPRRLPADDRHARFASASGTTSAFDDLSNSLRENPAPSTTFTDHEFSAAPPDTAAAKAPLLKQVEVIKSDS